MVTIFALMFAPVIARASEVAKHAGAAQG
eukprot:COSAG05_NODE_8692_length_680_cov_1.179002_1_plen_28_part_10